MSSVSVPTDSRSPALRTTFLRSSVRKLGISTRTVYAARLQVGDLEAAVPVADRDARVVGRLVDDRERRAGNDLTLRVGDGARDGSAHGLGGRGAGEQDGRDGHREGDEK